MAKIKKLKQKIIFNLQIKAFKIINIASKTYYYCSSWRTPLGEGAVNSHNHCTKT